MEFMLLAHDGFRWIVVLLGVITLLKYLVGWLGNQSYTNLDRRLMSSLNAVLGIQFLLGMIVLLTRVSIYSEVGWRVPLEHGVTNFIAISLVGMASARSRKAPNDQSRFMIGAIGLLIASALIFFAVAAVNGW